jgi:hypothetical protein
MPGLDVIDGRLVYEPDGAILSAYVADRSPVAVIVGPIGSGTSTASCMRIFATACEQKPSARDGRRHSRWAIVRTTYPELMTSTVKTWLTWFPESEYGTLVRSRPLNQVIRLGDLDLETWFLALDDEEDIRKLRSTEWTGIWFNEIEYQRYIIFQEAHSRVAQGRYPPMMEGGPTWHGIIADMNAPDEEHFVARMACAAGIPGFEGADYPDDIPMEDRLKWPSDWWIRKQPPGLIEVLSADGATVTGYVPNPFAENQKWLKGSYLEVIKGKSKRWIDSRVMNRVSFLAEGDPVWPNFKPERHLAPGPLPYVEGREVIVFLDFGRRPCALMAQEVGERIQIQREFRRYGVGATIFAPDLKRFLERHYRGATISFTGDPKGRDRGQATEKSAYDIFESHGMKVIPAPCRNNELPERIEAVSYALETSRILVSTECATLRPALAGKYRWKKLDDGEAIPVKDKYSDVADCLQYGCLFLGEGRRMVGLTAAAAARPVKVAKFRSLRRIVA